MSYYCFIIFSFPHFPLFPTSYLALWKCNYNLLSPLHQTLPTGQVHLLIMICLEAPERNSHPLRGCLERQQSIYNPKYACYKAFSYLESFGHFYNQVLPTKGTSSHRPVDKALKVVCRPLNHLIPPLCAIHASIPGPISKAPSFCSKSEVVPLRQKTYTSSPKVALE